MKAKLDTDILLESGTNEIEIMEFIICGNSYGINVAKVREIMIPEQVKPMPNTHPSVEGIFKPRDIIITVVNLPAFLNLDESDYSDSKTLLIIANFNNLHVAFRVHSVEGIHRISWTDIQKPDKTLYGEDEGVSTGIAQCDGRLITVLDLEKIVAEISPETSININEIDALGPRRDRPEVVMVVEDSVLLMKLITESLSRAGYKKVLKMNNGQEAWDYLSTLDRNVEDVYEYLSIIITDIEMPSMDGHRLIKLVKSNDYLRIIPMVIFSSLINEEMYRKGKEVGADEQLTKPEIGRLVGIMDDLIARAKEIMLDGE